MGIKRFVKGKLREFKKSQKYEAETRRLEKEVYKKSSRTQALKYAKQKAEIERSDRIRRLRASLKPRPPMGGLFGGSIFGSAGVTQGMQPVRRVRRRSKPKRKAVRRVRRQSRVVRQPIYSAVFGEY